jgi:hypothetical protein
MWEKTKIMRFVREPSLLHIRMGQIQLENVEYLNCLGSMVTNDARCACEIKSGLQWQNQHSTGRIIFSAANWS